MNTNHEAQMADRKAKHLEICIQESLYQVEGGNAGFENYRFIHRALPELNTKDIETSQTFLKHTISMPLFISSMTGGSEEGYKLNKILAQVAQKAKIPVGMGSIRILFRKPEVFPHFHLKKLAPDVPVVANLGAVQIRDMVHGTINETLKKLEVDALAIHLNPAQELFQPEGDRDFSGILEGIQRFCAQSPIPVIVKETGCGIGAQEVSKLLNAGVAYVNIAGSGGTNWAIVESYRAQGVLKSTAKDFSDWGSPTSMVLAALRQMEENSRLPHGTLQAKSMHQAKAVHEAETAIKKALESTTGTAKKKTKPQYKGLLGGRVLASGGIRTGQDLVKSIALGAYCSGTALPFIRAVHQGGEEAGLALVDYYRTSLVNTMLLTGSQTLNQLRMQPLLSNPAWNDMVAQYIRTMSVL